MRHLLRFSVFFAALQLVVSMKTTNGYDCTASCDTSLWFTGTTCYINAQSTSWTGWNTCPNNAMGGGLFLSCYDWCGYTFDKTGGCGSCTATPGASCGASSGTCKDTYECTAYDFGVGDHCSGSAPVTTSSCVGKACPECGYTCSDANPNVCRTTCGDSKLAGLEKCDDGDTKSGDGCSADCKSVEAGWSCSLLACGSGKSSCTKDCGNGIRTTSEACDDGDEAASDGCSAVCTVECGYTCSDANPNVCRTTCGDSKLAGLEKCDDGDTKSGDGCSADCKSVEAGWSCSLLACGKSSCVSIGVPPIVIKTPSDPDGCGGACSASCDSRSSGQCGCCSAGYLSDCSGSCGCSGAGCSNGYISGCYCPTLPKEPTKESTRIVVDPPQVEVKKPSERQEQKVAAAADEAARLTKILAGVLSPSLVILVISVVCCCRKTSDSEDAELSEISPSEISPPSGTTYEISGQIVMPAQGGPPPMAGPQGHGAPPAGAMPASVADKSGCGVWEPQKDLQTGKIYWTNHALQKTTWDPPTGGK